MTNLEEVRDAIRGVKKAKAKLAAIVERKFPLGSDVHWNKGGRRQYGVVLNHSSHAHLRVENERTGKQYWIGMYDVVGYVE